MQKRLYIGKKHTFKEKFNQKFANLSLLGKGDGAEVMIQEVDANEIVFIEPAEYSDVMEFFYILDGKLEIEKNKTKVSLSKDDYFYVHHLDEHVQFQTITDVKLLYFSTQPVFHYLSSTIKELTELAKIVEEKDIYTHGHTSRVKDYALKIGNKMRLSKEIIENIGFASLFHDIGKINVPDEILKKTGKLTDEEFEIMENHSAWGAEVVSKTYYEKLSEIIRQHHERNDGSGYPNNITDEEILIEAKVIAVADSYDAMTSDRPYRKAMTPSVAAEELISLKGSKYEGAVVEALIQVLKDDGVL
jgi:HD-GYP domain-containing protein (c-di-GMP phosphodiesterase class II)